MQLFLETPLFALVVHNLERIVRNAITSELTHHQIGQLRRDIYMRFLKALKHHVKTNNLNTQPLKGQMGHKYLIKASKSYLNQLSKKKFQFRSKLHFKQKKEKEERSSIQQEYLSNKQNSPKKNQEQDQCQGQQELKNDLYFDDFYQAQSHLHINAHNFFDFSMDDEEQNNFKQETIEQCGQRLFIENENCINDPFDDFPILNDQ